jgi:hypothetical protein
LIGGPVEGGAVERHIIGFQAAYARRRVKFELGGRLKPVFLDDAM